LKSPNVLVFGRESHDTLAVKIADFGLCRVVDKTMTMTQGTQLWRAPEVIGRCDYTKKADVYSFGIILWELMTGELPFSEHDKESSMVFDEAICKGRRPTIPKGSEKHPYVQLMQECWDKNPASRPHFADILTRVSAVRSMPERVTRPGRK
jgi:serine/threonine protein kinase